MNFITSSNDITLQQLQVAEGPLLTEHSTLGTAWAPTTLFISLSKKELYFYWTILFMVLYKHACLNSFILFYGLWVVVHASWRAKQSLNQCSMWTVESQDWSFPAFLVSWRLGVCLIEMITWSIWSVVANRSSKAMGMHAGHLSIYLFVGLMMG